MSTSSTSRGQRIRVWDPFVRLFHWTVVSGVLLAYLTEDFRSLHKTIGYIVLAAVLLRLGWGVIGSRHARFTDFVRGPSEVLRYARDILHGREERHLGHNPLGGVMVVALLTTLLVIGVSGWMTTLDMFWGEDWVEDLHAGAVNLLVFGLVPAHVAGVVFTSLRERTNLVKAMITGYKEYDTAGHRADAGSAGARAGGRI
ncbi:MAG TPA: cytochrome B [Rhodospirillales bacterium]|nr:cytochrome B [Rhodospirillales bacterium]